MNYNAVRTLVPGEHAVCFFHRDIQVIDVITSVARVLAGRPELHCLFTGGELAVQPLTRLTAGWARDLADQKLVVFPEPLTGDGCPPGQAVIRRLDEYLRKHPPLARVHLTVLLTGPALTHPPAQWFWHLGAFNSYLQQKNYSALSLYRKSAFPPLFVYQCLRVHPVVIAEEVVLTNPFYAPAVSLAAALGRPDPADACRNDTPDAPADDRAPPNPPDDAEAYRDLMAMTPNPVFLTDDNGCITFANAAADSLLQMPAATLAGLPYTTVVDPADREKAGRWLTNVLAGACAGPLEVRVRSRGGPARVRCHGSALARGGQILWEDLSVSDRLQVATLLQERLSQTCSQLKELTIRDPLTGLYNRQYFEEEVRRLRNPRQWPVSVLLIDVDGLKVINDQHGHARGDQILKRAAEAIKAPFREGDVIARIGGDEFAVVLPHTGLTSARARKEEILKKTAAANAGEEIPLSLSIGVAAGEVPAPDIRELINRADMDMYRVKRRSPRLPAPDD